MAAVIELDGEIARLDGGVWSCGDPSVLRLLRIATTLIEVSSNDADANPDLQVAQWLIDQLGRGRMVSEDDGKASTGASTS